MGDRRTGRPGGGLWRFSGRLAWRALRGFSYSLLGAAVVALVVFVLYLNQREELELWHLADLDREFTAESGIDSFEAYLALEQVLFRQLDARVYDRIPASERDIINRYDRGSLSYPGRWPRDWNRTFVLPVEQPKAAVLLLHGMSDSPYSLRAVGEMLNRAGAWVVGLRLPGHGTAPSGLVTVRWQDMAAAVRLAVRHLRDQVPGRPIHIVGYSNGGALGVEYALRALQDPALPPVERLVLISPAIGVHEVAALAVWQGRIGHLLGLDKLAWNSILPEYDPFKYNSFAVNAGDVVYRLTREIGARFAALDEAALRRFPPVLAFQSVVDATVSTPALVTGLFQQLPPGGHELVLFDINRQAAFQYLLARDPAAQIEALMGSAQRSFAVSLLTTDGPDSHDVVIVDAGADGVTSSRQTGMVWPAAVYSLTHVALPFPPDDPLYGGHVDGETPGIHLGDLAIKGERGVLKIAASELLRLRWNPFFGYLRQRILAFTGLAAD